MTSKNAIYRSPFAAAVLATALALATAARADDDAAARAAAVNDPEYKLGYSRAAQGTPYAGECNDKEYGEEFTKCKEQVLQRQGAPYAGECNDKEYGEEFTKCQEQTLQRASRDGRASDGASRMAKGGPRGE